MMQKLRPGRIIATVFVLLIALSISTYAQTWEPLNGPYAGYIEHLVVDNNNEVFASSRSRGLYKLNQSEMRWDNISSNTSGRGLFVTDDNTLYSGSSMAVHRSTDGGQTFETVYEITDTHYGVFDINAYGTLGNDMIFIGGPQILFTTDNCQTWQITDTEIPNQTKVYVAADSTLYAGTSENGLYRSNDFGATFSAINNGITNLFINDILVSPCGMIYAATKGGIFRSIDEGNSFQQMNVGLTNLDVRTIEFTNVGVMFAGTYYGGIFRSFDYGAHWTKINDNITDKYILDFAVKSSGEVFAGTTGGIYYSNNNGTNWQKINDGLKDRDLGPICISNRGDMICGSESYVYHSSDNGLSWNQYDLGLEEAYIRKCAFNDTTMFAIGFGGVYRSLDNGQNWENLTGNFLNKYFHEILVDSFGVIYLGGYDNYISYDNGDSWQQITAFWQDFWRMAKNSRQEIYAVNNDGIRKTSDQGTTWQLIHDNSVTGRIYDIHIDQNDIIYVNTTDSGLFKSTNNGQSWISISNDPSIAFLFTIASDYNNYLYAPAYNNGIYRSIDQGATWDQFNLNLPVSGYNYYVTSSQGEVFAYDENLKQFYHLSLGCSDKDGDWICDEIDNCAAKFNPDQTDKNADGIGDICCCQGMRGNINGDELDQIDIDDLVYFVDYQFRSGPPPACLEEADISPINNPDGIIDIGDIVVMVNYQFRGGDAPGSCP